MQIKLDVLLVLLNYAFYPVTITRSHLTSDTWLIGPVLGGKDYCNYDGRKIKHMSQEWQKTLSEFKNKDKILDMFKQDMPEFLEICPFDTWWI